MIDLWESHIEGLTRQLAITQEKVEIMEQRLEFYEIVLAALLIALKQGGVLVDDPDGKHTMPS